MSTTLFFDIIAAMGCIVTLYITLTNKYHKAGIKTLVSGIGLLGLIYYVSIAISSVSSNDYLEPLEDIFGVLLTLWWAFLFYGLYNNTFVAALSQSEKRYKDLIDHIPGAVYRCDMDKDWTMHFISDYIQTLSGYPASDFISNSVRSYNNIIHPDDRKRVWEEIQTKVVQQKYYNLEYRIIDSEGKTHWVVEKGQAMENSSSGILQIHGAIFDITKRKRAEQEQEKTNVILASKNEELESIFQVTSHDLKSPTTNIIGFSGELEKATNNLKSIVHSDGSAYDENSLRQPPPKSLPAIMADIDECLKFITISANKLNQMLDGLLKLSRLSKKKINSETIDMNRLVENMRQTCAYQFKKNNIILTADPLPSCTGDKFMVEQVFTNLVDNAIKYASPDEQCQIHISGRVENDRSIYCVCDNGIGIEEENLDNIFDLFYRINPDDEPSGDGLGLTIVKRMLKLQNGDIHVESKLDEGSRFYVEIPNW